VPYEPFVHLLKKSYLILTDSGGIQEEVSVLGTPTLVMREFTEREEAVNAGNTKLVPINQKSITEMVNRLLKDKEFYSAMAKKHNSFGDGKASERIVKLILNLK
jgi:UDP-N-acetylglucosamine 2-epimerase (non-hydrolysing)